MNTTKTILGIDPGLHHTGWAIINYNGLKYEFVACGTVTTNPKDEIPIRLHQISLELENAIKNYKPTIAGIEETFVNKNNLSSLKLGQARGAIIVTIARLNIQIYEYSATKVKKSITGVGRAEKEQIEMMVKVLIPKANPKTEHEADAIAIAITTANYS